MDDKFGWDGDIWDSGQPHGSPWDGHDAARAGGTDAAAGMGRACRNLGIAALAMSVLAFAWLHIFGMAAALVLAAASKRKGAEARAAGYDGPAVKQGMALSTLARAVSALYILLVIVSIVFLVVVVGGIFYYAGSVH